MTKEKVIKNVITITLSDKGKDKVEIKINRKISEEETNALKNATLNINNAIVNSLNEFRKVEN